MTANCCEGTRPSEGTAVPGWALAAGRTGMRPYRVGVLAALLGCITGIGLGVAYAGANDVAVTIDNFTFAPKAITVKAGTSVTWVNQDDIPHTVASVTKQFKSKALDTGDKFVFTFISPGTYEYFCSLHPHMTATIVVEPASAAATGL